LPAWDIRRNHRHRGPSVVNDERLWAPWRLAYITGKADEQPAAPEPIAWRDGADHDCFLCRAAATYDDAQADRKLLVANRGPHALVVLNRYPYNNGHLLVAPPRHVAELGALSRDEQLACTDALVRMTAVLGERLQAEGFNVGLNLGRVAGAGVPGHLHWHLVPRWPGDHSFMPVVADTHVIPQSLDALWELLADAVRG
jgi:ATP adenylyltransferase